MKLQCRELELELGRRTYIMGILNLTPDSFSDGGKYNQIEAALQHAKEMIEEGADILDIGGESTRPGHIQISEEEEIERVLPVIRSLRKQFPHVLLSIDTYKWKVAEAALEAGVHILNDIWGLQYDKGEMAALAKKYEVPVIVMHNQNTEEYQEDRVQTLRKFLKRVLKLQKESDCQKKNCCWIRDWDLEKAFRRCGTFGKIVRAARYGTYLTGNFQEKIYRNSLQGLSSGRESGGNCSNHSYWNSTRS